MNKIINLWELNRILKYDHNTGKFTWNINTSKMKKGDSAGSIHSKGYIKIKIIGKIYYAHRLAWFITYGEWPDKNIDHIDRVKTNNAISNLRLATPGENICNTGLSKANKSGLKGVYWDKKNKKLRVQIIHKRKIFYIGVFKSLDLAEIEMIKKRKIIHGEFACYK